MEVGKSCRRWSRRLLMELLNQPHAGTERVLGNLCSNGAINLFVLVKTRSSVPQLNLICVGYHL